MSDGTQITWGDHEWFQPRPRQLELETGQSVLHRQCTRCGRNFLIDASSGDRHAVHVSIFSFHRLHDEVNERWLTQRCPGKRLSSDDHDKNRWVNELPIKWKRS